MNSLATQNLHDQLASLKAFQVGEETYTIEDGRVYRDSDDHFAFVLSPGFGGNWAYGFSDDDSHTKTMVFHPFFIWILLNEKKVTEEQACELVYFIEKGRLQQEANAVGTDSIVTVDTLGELDDFYISSGGWDQCQVVFLPRGTKFRITEYDGSEGYETKNDINWL